MTLRSRTRSVRIMTTAAVLAGILLSATSVFAHNFDVFRGVDANATTGRATLSPSQFNFNPGLSTFDSPANAPVQKACNYRFTITNLPNNPPQVNDQGDVMGLPAGYTATFDNNPAGHWDISHPATVNATQAKAAVSVYAQANRGNVVNGTQANCN